MRNPPVEMPAEKFSNSTGKITITGPEGRGRAARTLLAQEVAGDDEVLDLGRPFVDPQGAHRAVEPIDDARREHAAAAEDLHRVVHDALRRLGGEELRHRGLAGDPRGAAVALPGGAKGEQARGHEIGRHARRAWPATSWNSASAAPNWRRARAWASASSSARAAMPQAAAATVGRSGRGVRMPSLKPSPSARRASAEAGIRQRLERQLAQRMRLREHVGRDEAQPGRRGRHQEAGDAARPLRAVGRGEDAVEVGDAGVGDEALRAVEHPGVAVATGRRGDRADVASRPRARSSRSRRSPGRRRPAGSHRRALRGAAGERDRHRAESLQREEGVGERRGPAERLADQAERAQLGLASLCAAARARSSPETPPERHASAGPRRP